MADVELRAIEKRFDDVRALECVSIDVADSEMMVLVGPSGCGKTTLLRILAGLEQASSGEVVIGGTVVNDVPAKARDVAMVFQNYALYPHMSVEENIAFGLRMHGVARSERRSRVGGISAMLGLEGMLARLPAALSGGQRQRVAMGRAVARRPTVFLMDEPLSNLDAELRHRVRGEIKALQRELGVTTIYVTHDQVEAMTLADRIAVFRAGRLQQVGPPDLLYARPANLFVAGFLGTPPMSFLRCRLENGRLHAEGLEGAFLPVERARLAADGNVVLGVRSEDLELGGAGVRWTGAVRLVEVLGGEVLAHVANGSGDLTLRLPRGERVSEGSQVTVGFELAAAHLFAADGRLISHGADPVGGQSRC